MPALTVHNAEIRTASVEVKTLTIAGKQVTQSVFKQLKDRELITGDGRLVGQPWGVVNYHPGKCADADPHLHVVWQLGTDLFRSHVGLATTYPRWVEVRNGKAWVDAKLREDLTDGVSKWNPLQDEFLRAFAGVTVRLVMSDEASSASLSRQKLDRLRAELAEHGPSHRVRQFIRGFQWSDHPTVPVADAIALAEIEFREALAKLPKQSFAEAEATLMAEIRGEVERRGRHRDVRTALSDLPQLFIAV